MIVCSSPLVNHYAIILYRISRGNFPHVQVVQQFFAPFAKMQTHFLTVTMVAANCPNLEFAHKELLEIG